MRSCSLAIVLAIASCAGCASKVDLKGTLQVSDLSGGFYDAGVVEGRNKLVPSISFRLHKSTDDTIRPLSLNVVFKKLPVVGAPPGAAPPEEDWDEVYLQSVDFQGNETKPLTVRPKAGYTGDPPQSRADMLKNSQFRDVRVHVFAKHSSSQWIEIARYDLPRQLLTAQ